MTKYAALVSLLISSICQTTAYPVFGFDYSVCTYYNKSAGGPMPGWAEGYSTNVEWKVLGKNTTVGVQEFWDPIDKIRSITASIEGTKVQNTISDQYTEYYTIKNNKCTTSKLETEMVFFSDEYGLEWVTITKDWYKLMLLEKVVKKDPTVIRSTSVNHWTSCLYVINADITAQVDFYFATNWAMPQIDPNVMIPVRLEIRGKINGTDSKAFHVIGDFFNFNPTPAFDPQNLQPPPGIFCPGKYPGQDIIKLPKSFYGIIEIINRQKSTITFQEIWFHADQKFVRFDTKASDGSDSDPYMNIIDFNTGVLYKVDKYIGTCQSGLVVIGENFVKARNGDQIDIVTVPEFFNLANAQVQYVGKRWTRGILCDVWVGSYFDDSVSKNFTAEWYFAAEGWKEAVGLILQTGSFIKMDVFSGAPYPMSYQIHRMDPIAPPLSVFDLSNCFQSSQKAHFVVRFSVQGHDFIPLISQLYLKETLQSKLTSTAFIETTRITNVFMEHFGGPEFYFIGTLLDKAPIINPNLVMPPIKQQPLESAYDFLRGAIIHVKQNITTSTGQTVIFVGVNIIRLNYQAELTTTVAKSTPTPPYIVPTLPHSTQSTSSKQPLTPPIPTTTKKTPTPPIPVKKTTISTATTTPVPKLSTLTSVTPKPCICPNVICPTAKAVSSTPKVTCPTVKQQQAPTTATPTTAKPTTVPNSTPGHPLTNAPKSTPKPRITNKPQTNCSALLSQMQHGTKKTSGVSGGGAAGIAIATLLVGILIGIFAMRFYHIRKGAHPPLISNMESNDSY